jgi:hypothetical protein
MDKTIQVMRGEYFYREDDDAQEFFILLKGKATYDFANSFIEGENSSGELALPMYTNGSILGIAELFSGEKRLYSLIAAEDCECLPVFIGDNSIEALFLARPNYSPLLAQAAIYQSNSFFKFSQSLARDYHALRTLALGSTIYFWHLKKMIGLRFMPTGNIFAIGKDLFHAMELTGKISPNLSFNDCLYHTALAMNEEINLPCEIKGNMDYLVSLDQIPSEILKSFLSSDPYIALHNSLPAAELLNFSLTSIKTIISETKTTFNFLVKSDEGTLFSSLLLACKEISNNAGNNSPFVEMLEMLKQKTKEIHQHWLSEYAIVMSYEAKLFDTALEAVKVSKLDVSASDIVVPEELKNSLFRLLQYADLPYATADKLRTAVEAFRDLTDKNSSEKTVADIRLDIVTTYFDLYKAIVTKAIKENNKNPLIELFLNYGFIDENLVSPESMINLLSTERSDIGGICNFYSLPSWMEAIYRMEKAPSINEYEQDYFEVFRQMKKRGEVSDKDLPAYSGNQEARLNFELDNFCRSAIKTCHGKLPVYVPILYEEVFQRDVSRCHVTAGKVNSAVMKVLDVDFSLFHRDVFYRNEKLGIDSEMVMKAIAPDLIMVPVCGGRAAAWQAIAGRDRSTPGRIVFPILSNESVDELVQKALSYFRWELCRTMAGMSWNDIRIRSLTSQYIDYTQFYKKNRHLSEEAKEKLRLQLSRSRSPKDVFSTDYIIWLNYESKGSIRLNKVARGILYENVPLALSYREKLKSLPSFLEHNNAYEIKRKKKVKELELKYFYYQKLPGGLPKELEENLFFYKEM